MPAALVESPARAMSRSRTVPAPAAPAAAPGAAPIAARSWHALGTNVHVVVIDPRTLDDASDAVRDVLGAVDATYSRFRSDSELSLLNRSHGECLRVSPLLGRAIGAALRAARQTDGAVDPTVGRAMRLVGYDRDFGRIAGGIGPLALRLEPVPGWRAVMFDPVARSVCLPRGVEVDLGSTGKALAVDLAVEAAHRATGRGVLVSLGGDVASAGETPKGGWRILAAEDSETPADSSGDVFAIAGGAVATSSTTVRRWTAGGVHLHHIIDPWSGLPARGPWRTASVAAATCVEANAAATAAIVRGEDAVDWLESVGLSARLVSQSADVRYVGRWSYGAGEGRAA